MNENSEIIFETDTAVVSLAPGQLAVHVTKNYSEKDVLKCALVACLLDNKSDFEISDEKLSEILHAIQDKGFSLEKNMLNILGARIISIN